MDQFRMLMAVVLSFIVFMVWQFVFVKPEPAQKDTPVETQAPVQPDNSYVDAVRKPLQPTAPMTSPETTPTKPIRLAKAITIDTPLYIARLSENGAVIKSMKLKKYRETVDKASPPKELFEETLPEGALKCSLARNSLPEMGRAVFTSEGETEWLSVTDQKASITLSWQSESGVAVEKRFTFYPDSYLVGLDVTLKNGSPYPLQDQLVLSMTDPLPDGASRIGFTGPSALVNNQVEEIKIKKLEEKNTLSGTLDWVAFQDRYFIRSLIPASAVDATARFQLISDKFIESRLISPETTTHPQIQQTQSLYAYFGPKSVSELRATGKKLEQTVDLGWFDFLARPILWLMNAIYKVIPNYGVTIIILTILIKIILWPLGNKSYKSMGQMKKMQPLMAEIRERYKDDKQKQNQEVMALYRTYKVNPLGGCLPMVAQIPVFFAFYQMLYAAFELRHAPFAGWINDLSAPDRLFEFGFSIPFMEPPYGIPVLTIIMGASMLWQQKMQPPMGDPAQAKMMMFMPVVFTFIFINFSSGLVLYWLTNNILGIMQQYYVTKKTA